jgi:glutamine synthetase
MHCHVSLWEGRNDNSRNAFVPHNADGSVDSGATLSPLGRQFVAGVLAHAGALCALAAPTVNSYKRLTVGESITGTTWAPAYVAHGRNNRTALVRTLHGRFEWRAPDASANPYLLLAGLIAAGLDGIERELDPGPGCDADLFELSLAQVGERGIALLPQHLGQAVDALEADATICAALGDTLAREFIAAKRDEHIAYARHVSDWELRRYVTAF